MKPLTREWIQKAEGDLASAGRELRARKQPNYDSACFHSQQCAEKFMKATPIEAGIQFERTHDLPALLDLLRAINAFWEALRQAATTLSDYAVRFRYPGSSADKAMAKIAFQACEVVRETLREHLGMSATSSSKPKAKSEARKRRQSRPKSK
ncbi:MAG: HEPN domain-containing protein [Planctomycetes bacterium]|nr:HEPN domain-containing protein [Planctomycetota bacterium]